MKLSSAYARLLKLRTPVLRTVDAAATLDVSSVHASQILARLSKEGFLSPVKRGYWAFSNLKDPMLLAEYLTAPYPAYISLQSALFYHGMISQIPVVHYVVSLARTCRAGNEFGTFSIHHVSREFFFGYQRVGGIAIAEPEKALIDVFYLQQNQPKLFKALPELELAGKIRQKKCRQIVTRIASAQRRCRVEDRLKALGVFK